VPMSLAGVGTVADGGIGYVTYSNCAWPNPLKNPLPVCAATCRMLSMWPRTTPWDLPRLQEVGQCRSVTSRSEPAVPIWPFRGQFT